MNGCDYMNNYLSTNLKHLRIEKGYSLAFLGALLHKTRQTIFRWEKAQRTPSIDELLILSNFYNISLDDLIKKDLKK